MPAALQDRYHVGGVSCNTYTMTAAHDTCETLLCLMHGYRELPGVSLGHGDEVEDCIGRPPESHDQNDGVLKRLEGHDIPWLDVTFEELQHVPLSIEYRAMIIQLRQGNAFFAPPCRFLDAPERLLLPTPGVFPPGLTSRPYGTRPS